MVRKMEDGWLTCTHTHTQFIPLGGLNPKGQPSLVYIQLLKMILVFQSPYSLGLFPYFSALFSADARGLVVSGVSRLERHSLTSYPRQLKRAYSARHEVVVVGRVGEDDRLKQQSCILYSRVKCRESDLSRQLKPHDN